MRISVYEGDVEVLLPLSLSQHLLFQTVLLCKIQLLFKYAKVMKRGGELVRINLESHRQCGEQMESGTSSKFCIFACNLHMPA